MKPHSASSNKNAPASCGRCSAQWSAANVAHCAGCCRTFTGIGAFDRHRSVGRCLDPASVGLVFNARGRWGHEPMTDAEKRRRFGPEGQARS